MGGQRGQESWWGVEYEQSILMYMHENLIMKSIIFAC